MTALASLLRLEAGEACGRDKQTSEGMFVLLHVVFCTDDGPAVT